MNDVLPAIGALIPSVGVGLLFWFAMRYIVRADRNDQHAGERRPRAPGHVENDRVETDGVGEAFPRHHVADDRGPRRLLKGLDTSHGESGDVDMPGLDLAGKDQHRERSEHGAIDDLGDQDLRLARIAVGGAAGDGG